MRNITMINTNILQEQIAKTVQNELNNQMANNTNNETMQTDKHIISKVIYEDNLEEKMDIIKTISEKCKKTVKKETDNLKSNELNSQGVNNMNSRKVQARKPNANARVVNENYEKYRLAKNIQNKLKSNINGKNVDIKQIEGILESIVDQAVKNVLQREARKNRGKTYKSTVGENKYRRMNKRVPMVREQHMRSSVSRPVLETRKPVQPSRIRVIEARKPVQPSRMRNIEARKPVQPSRIRVIEARKPVQPSRMRNIEARKPVQMPKNRTIEDRNVVIDNRKKIIENKIKDKKINEITETIKKSKGVTSKVTENVFPELSKMFDSNASTYVGKQPIKVQDNLDNDFFKLF